MSIGLKRDRVLRDDRGQTIASATRTLQLEAEGLSALKAALAGDLIDSFAQAIEILRSCRGRVIVTGMGKSGHVGLKVAATLSSTGSPAYFVHPSEASHGDLGMITRDDVILAFSWSGETVELGNIVSYSRRFAVPLVAVTSNPGSTLAEAADLVLALPQAKEACPHGLAPTTSTVMQLALGDCLAMALLDSKGFTARDFKMLHPGGQLGARLKFVSDLRRHMGDGLLARRAQEIMTPAPKTVSPDLLASAALELINATRITALFVVENGRPVGIIHVHDLLRAGVA